MLQILIVDDDKNIRRYLGAVLSDAGYSISSADCAQQALDIMENTRIDLIVLDIMMPGMDGCAFTELLRDCNNDIPILMLSAKQLPEDIKKGFLSGTDDYMTKPVDEDVMLLRIRALLRRAKIISDRRLTVGSTILDYDTLTAKRSVNCFPRKNFSSYTSFCPIRIKYLPEYSLWRISGALPPIPRTLRSASTLTVLENALKPVLISRSSRSGGLDIKRR